MDLSEGILFNTDRIDHLYEDHIDNSKFILHYGDMTDNKLIRLIKLIYFDEIYNLAAMSHVKVSFEIPEYTANTDALGLWEF